MRCQSVKKKVCIYSCSKYCTSRLCDIFNLPFFIRLQILKNVLAAILHLIAMHGDRSLQALKSINTFSTHLVLHNESHMGLEQCKGELFIFDE